MKKSNIFKIAALTAVFAVAGMFANAQQTDPTSIELNKQTPVNGSVVKVIDNKGTVKFLQSANGITTITSNVIGNQTTTTFQLGGTLLENTYIDVAGNIFGLNNIPVTSELPAELADATSTDATVGNGYTLLVRNEETGAIEKLLVTDLVQAGWSVYKLSSPTPETSFTIPGVSLASFQTVYVYRNGAKLIAGIDYELGATDNKVTLFPGTGTQGLPTGAGVGESYVLYPNDIIEIHFIK